MTLFGRWLADAIRLSAALAMALFAMQAPALTHDYRSGLLQVSQEIGHDIQQREDAARRFYNLDSGSAADQVMATLAAREPSNLETLRQSQSRAQALRDAYDRIAASAPLVQPLTMLLDNIFRAIDVKSDVMRTALQSFTPGVVLSIASAVYGLAGLFIGSLAANLMLGAVVFLGGRDRREGRRYHSS